MLDNPASYEVHNFKDYSGPGFKRYKASPYFKPPSIRSFVTLTKAEVAAYSEMTKIALLLGMGLIFFIAAWWDVKFAQLLFGGNIDISLLFSFSLLALILTYAGVAMLPRTFFIIINFKVTNK